MKANEKLIAQAPDSSEVRTIQDRLLKERMEAIEALRDALDAHLPLNQRLWDLVRHQRSELHVAGLISDAEYTELAKDHAAVGRLETYDALQARRVGRYTQGRLDEFLCLKAKQPMDPAYWDMYHERQLREAAAQESQAAPRQRIKVTFPGEVVRYADNLYLFGHDTTCPERIEIEDVPADYVDYSHSQECCLRYITKAEALLGDFGCTCKPDAAPKQDGMQE